MTNKQPAALRLHLLPVMDKLLTLTAPVPGPLLLFTGHPDHCQRVFVASQVTVQAQAECAAIASISLHASGPTTLPGSACRHSIRRVLRSALVLSPLGRRHHQSR